LETRQNSINFLGIGVMTAVIALGSLSYSKKAEAVIGFVINQAIGQAVVWANFGLATRKLGRNTQQGQQIGGGALYGCMRHKRFQTIPGYRNINNLPVNGGLYCGWQYKHSWGFVKQLIVNCQDQGASAAFYRVGKGWAGSGRGWHYFFRTIRGCSDRYGGYCSPASGHCSRALYYTKNMDFRLKPRG